MTDIGQLLAWFEDRCERAVRLGTVTPHERCNALSRYASGVPVKRLKSDFLPTSCRNQRGYFSRARK